MVWKKQIMKFESISGFFNVTIKYFLFITYECAAKIASVLFNFGIISIGICF